MRNALLRNVGLSLTASAAILSTSVLATDNVTFQLDWLPGGDKSPVYLAVEKGYFKDVDIEVKILSGRGSADAITRVATGQAEMGSADIATLMAAKAQDSSLPVKAVYSLFNQAPHAFFALEKSGIKSVTDIKDKQVATSPFSSSNAFLPLVLSENGLPEDSVKLTKADPGALAPLLANERTEAVISWVTNTPLYAAQAEAVGEKLVSLPWSDAGLSLYSSSLVANQTFLAEQPDVAKRFLAAYDKALRETISNPSVAAIALKTMVPEVDVAVVEAQINASIPLISNDISTRDGVGALTQTRVVQTWEWVAKAEKLSVDTLDPESIIDRSLLESLN